MGIFVLLLGKLVTITISVKKKAIASMKKHLENEYEPLDLLEEGNKL